jgi:hypothetical protein
MISAALFTALSASLLALASPLAMRAGAPSSPQSITVSDLTECGVANISFSGPGVVRPSIPTSTDVAVWGGKRASFRKGKTGLKLELTRPVGRATLQEPYTLEIGTGGFYVGIEEIVTYTNITANETSVFWIVNQPVRLSSFPFPLELFNWCRQKLIIWMFS